MVSLTEYPFRLKPYDHQYKVIDETWMKEYWALFLEMGTGKSKICVDTFCMQYLNGMIDTVVIFAKKGEYANWYYDQLPQHMPEGVEYEAFLYSTYGILLTAGKKAFASIRDPEPKRLRIVIMNIEAINSKAGNEVLKAMYDTSKLGVSLNIDESTCVKHHKSKRSAEAYFWAAKSKFRRIMTGSGITQSPLDLWGQCMALKKGILGCSSYYSFRGRYAEMETLYLGQRRVETIAGYKNLDELYQVMKRFSHRILKSECLDLPEKIYKKVYVELSKEQQRLYTELRDLAITELNGKGVEITNVLALITKLHQISCGQFKFDDGTYSSIENNRIDALIDILDDHEGKAIIWANYRQTLHDIVSALRKQYGDEAIVSYYGGVSEEDRRYAIQSFQDPSSKVRFFIANPQSAGYGITLTQANLVVYYSNSYNLEHRIQSEDRAHRIGQTEKVVYIDMISKDTIDERIVGILRDKKNISDLVMNGKLSLEEWL